MLSKREKSRLREEKIIEMANVLITEEGFFNVRMSDLAKKAEISVGSLYVHFESKEDLIVGIGVYNLKQQMEHMKGSNTVYSDVIDRLMAVLLFKHLQDEKNGEITEIGNMAQVPSVWERASYRRTEELSQQLKVFADYSRNIINEALERGELNPEQRSEVTPYFINATIWGLANGLHKIFNIQSVREHKVLNKNSPSEIYIDAVETFLRGYGCKRENLKARLFKILAELKEQAEY